MTSPFSPPYTPPTVLPLPWVTVASPGSQWVSSFQFYDDDGNLTDITGKIFELVIRASTRTPGTPTVSVTSTTVTDQGTITVDTTTSTIQVVLTPTGTATMTATDTYAVTLWMDQGLSDATAMVNGTIRIRPVVAVA